MTISITNIVSLVNGVLWNRFMVATTFSNIPCIWYWARFILAICQRSDRGPFVQRIHWLFKTWNARLQNCRCAQVMLICFKIFGELEIFDAKHWSDWCRLEKDVIFKSRLLIDGCICRLSLGYHTLRKSYQTFENMRSLCNLNVNGAELSPIWALLRRIS